MSSRLGLRPTATSSCSARQGPRRRPRARTPPSCSTRRISTPTRTSTPSARSARATTSPASGSSGPSSRSSASSSVTRRPEPGERLRQLAPDRAAAEHRPATPAPRSDAHRPRGWSSTACRRGRRPAAPPARCRCRARRRGGRRTSCRRPRPGPGRRAGRARGRSGPRPPRAGRRAWSSCQSWLASRIRRSPAARRQPLAARGAERIISFDGVQPQNGHSPPTRSRSTPTTARPASASLRAAYSPPGAEPEHDDVDVAGHAPGHRDRCRARAKREQPVADEPDGDQARAGPGRTAGRAPR